MNLLLVDNEQIKDNRLLLQDQRQIEHLINVLRIKNGDSIQVGIINGHIGKATILDIKQHSITLNIHATKPPPPPLPCILILALPRPKMLSRVIQNATSMGIKEIHLINSSKVEKSFWKSPSLSQEKLGHQFILGLEQSKDTLLPSIQLHQLFRPFAEDQLPTIIQSKRAFVAHPNSSNTCPSQITFSSTLIIGPEGGFTPFEIELLEKQGVLAVSIGERILRVETAIPAILGRMYPNF